MENGRTTIDGVVPQPAMHKIGENDFGALAATVRPKTFSTLALCRVRKPIGLSAAFAAGMIVWHGAAASDLDTHAARFLGTIAGAVVLWILDIFDDYVVALMLLLSWVALDIVAPKVALAGFSQTSWLFVVAALAMGAAIRDSGLLQRVAVCLLIQLRLTTLRSRTMALFASGLLMTPLLPTGKARTIIALPVSAAISKAAGFGDRSNASAALGLTTLVAFSQMSFMFLTGAESCLLGWNLMPEYAKAEFGWVTWALAALPAGLVICLCVFTSIHLLFPVAPHDDGSALGRSSAGEFKHPGPLTKAEKVAIAVLAFTLVGWLSAPVHGIDETWIALSGLVVFLATGRLDKKSLRNEVDWGLVLFFGIVNSMALVSKELHIDRWLTTIVTPVLVGSSFGPTGFLTAVFFIVCLARVCLRKAAAVAVLGLVLLPLGEKAGIHPGVILITLLMANECFLLAYQEGTYQIAYSSSDGRAFSHAQARRVLAAKTIATLLAIVVSVPYWRALGFIR